MCSFASNGWIWETLNTQKKPLNTQKRDISCLTTSCSIDATFQQHRVRSEWVYCLLNRLIFLNSVQLLDFHTEKLSICQFFSLDESFAVLRKCQSLMLELERWFHSHISGSVAGVFCRQSAKLSCKPRQKRKRPDRETQRLLRDEIIKIIHCETAYIVQGDKKRVFIEPS